MIHKLLLITVSAVTLATCQSKKTMETATKADSTEVTTSISATETVENPSTTTPATSTAKEPEMSTGMPPDAEAEKIAKQEQEQQVSGKMANTAANTVYLKEGQSKSHAASGMIIKFKKVIEDSRCPKDVNCVWEGVATIEIEVTGKATRPVTLQISTMDNASRGNQTFANFNGYNISLLELSPETTSEKGFKSLQGNYKIGLKIEKGTGSPDVQQRGGATTK